MSFKFYVLSPSTKEDQQHIISVASIPHYFPEDYGVQAFSDGKQVYALVLHNIFELKCYSTECTWMQMEQYVEKIDVDFAMVLPKEYAC